MTSMKDMLGDTPYPSPSRAFGGQTYDHKRDFVRLTGQLEAVYLLMRDGKWRTLDEMAKQVAGSPAAISARLRDLRKPKFGGHVVEREYISDGVWKYRVGS